MPIYPCKGLPWNDMQAINKCTNPIKCCKCIHSFSHIFGGFTGSLAMPGHCLPGILYGPIWCCTTELNKWIQAVAHHRHTFLPCKLNLIASAACLKCFLIKLFEFLCCCIISDSNHIIANANSMLGYLKRNFRLAPVSLKLLMYKTLVRSKLDYAAAIWDPGLSTLVTDLEALQNRGARFIFTNYHRTSSVSTMKTNLSLPALSLRRKISRLCLFYKIYHSNTSLKNKLMLNPVFISPRVDHQCKVGIPHCVTSAYYNSFIPRTYSEWNRLPAQLVNIPSFDLFKSALTTYLC